MSGDVSRPHPDYAAFAADWQVMRDAIEGADAVRKRGTDYLPMPSGFKAQTDGGRAMYAAYQTRAQFPDLLTPAIGAMVGVIHQSEFQISIPDSMDWLWESATRDGMSLEAFHRRLTRELLEVGRYGLLVEAPEGGGDPYLAGYTAEAIINWSPERDMFVLDESGRVRDGFSWKDEKRFRALLLENGRYVQQTYTGDNADRGEDVNPTARGNKDLDEIPFVVMSARDVMVEPERPPLIGVARSALAIYRLDADYRHQLFNSGQETRQFSDVGVSLATGMNPLLVFIQQGLQIADVFQQAAAEGRNFNTVLTGLYARLAPLLVPLAAVATAAGVAAGAFGLFHRSMSDDAGGDLSKSLNLTKEQLDRLKESGVSTSVTIGDTFKATFQEIGANIVGAMSPVTSWLAETWGVTMDSITEAAVTGSQAVLAFFVGTYRAIMATWRNFPAAFGDMVIQGANAAITALNGLINRAVDGLNWLDAKFAGGQMQVAHFQAVLLQNPVAGAAARDAAETAAI